MLSAFLELAELTSFRLRSLAEKSELEVLHLVAKKLEQLALLNVECLSFAANVDISLKINRIV